MPQNRPPGRVGDPVLQRIINDIYRLLDANSAAASAALASASSSSSSSSSLSTPYFIQVAAGTVAGASSINRFGKNPDIDSGVEEDLWASGGSYPDPITTAETWDVTSADANDTSAGTGARTVLFEGLDSSYEEASETVTLNGGTVTTSGTYVMCHKMTVVTVGSGGENAGAITAAPTTTGTDRANIAAGENRTFLTAYMVPANKTAHMVLFYASMKRSASARVDFRITETDFTNGVMMNAVEGGLTGSGTSSYQHIFGNQGPGPVFAEKTLIRMLGTSNTNNTEIAGGYTLLLLDN